MNEYSVDDYRNLENGAQNIDSTIGELQSTLETGTNTLNSIMNESTFSGPVANHCAEVWGLINKATQNNLNNFSNNAKALRNISTGYKDSDTNVSKDIGGV